MVILSIINAWNSAWQSVHKEGLSQTLIWHINVWEHVKPIVTQCVWEHVKPIVTQCAPMHIFNLNEIALFYKV
jgi:hypothetical protein